MSYLGSPSFGTGHSKITLDKIAVCGCLLWTIGGGGTLASHLIAAEAATTAAPYLYDRADVFPAPKITKMS